MISREWLLDNFTYNPDTGHINHKPKDPKSYGTMSKSRILKRLRADRAEVFRERKKGCSYYAIVKGPKAIYAHRAAYWMYHGELPKIIDHINGNTFDNRICNLRASNYLQNNRNCSIQKNNKTGVVGVRMVRGKFYAAIGHEGKNIHLGVFDSIEEASSARAEAEIEYGYEINHGKRVSQSMDSSIEDMARAEVGATTR